MKLTDKSEEMIQNYINGNIADFKEEVFKLNKVDLVCFLQYCFGYYGNEAHGILYVLARGK